MKEGRVWTLDLERARRYAEGSEADQRAAIVLALVDIAESLRAQTYVNETGAGNGR